MPSSDEEEFLPLEPAASHSLFDRILLALLGGVTKLFEKLSIDRSIALGATLGRAWDRVGGPRTRRVRRQLEVAMPDAEAAQRRLWAREVFVHLGRGLAELIILRGRRRGELFDRVRVEGLENLAAAEQQSSTGGLLIVTAHYGNWELACAKVVDLGIPISVVYREFENPTLDRISFEIRSPGLTAESGGPRLEQIPMGRAGLRFVRALKEGRKVLVLLDQDANREEGLFVSFFGRPASTRSGPLALASLRGTPVLPAFIRRSPDGRSHVLEIHPALQLEPGASDDEEVLRRNTQQVTAVIEEVIRKSPGQWIWTHRRWRTQPMADEEKEEPASR
jgi:KDO2-lipid IV(A) lauroyltransferase